MGVLTQETADNLEIVEAFQNWGQFEVNTAGWHPSWSCFCLHMWFPGAGNITEGLPGDSVEMPVIRPTPGLLPPNHAARDSGVPHAAGSPALCCLRTVNMGLCRLLKGLWLLLCVKLEALEKWVRAEACSENPCERGRALKTRWRLWPGHR